MLSRVISRRRIRSGASKECVCVSFAEGLSKLWLVVALVTGVLCRDVYFGARVRFKGPHV